MKRKSLYLPVLVTTLILVMAAPLINVGVVTACRGSTHIILYPSGGDDTAQIQAAFDMVAGKKRSTIELAAGVFTVSEPIQAADFDGTFKGAGKDLTIVQTVDEFGIGQLPLVPFGYVFAFYQENKGTSRGTATKVALSDMTIQAVGNTQDWQQFSWTFKFYLFLVWITGGYDVEEIGPGAYHVEGRETFVSSSFTRMRFLGDPTADWGVADGISINTLGALDIVDGNVDPSMMGMGTKPLVGKHTVTDSEFEWVLRYSCNPMGLYDSTFTFNRNTVSYSYFPGGGILGCFNIYNSYVRVSHCETFHSTLGAIVNGQSYFQLDGVDPSPSKYYFAHNTIQMIPGEPWAGLEIVDQIGGENQHSIKLVMLCNTFICEDNTAIWAFNVDGAKLIKNTVKGTGPVGIEVDGPSDRWWILCNDFDDFTASAADIYLGPESTNCFAVVHDTDTVEDLGTDNRIIRLPF
ncbi:MAG: hypothetical protein ACFE8O_05125 [Candidatus Hermodarchaeota archaeon]